MSDDYSFFRLTDAQRVEANAEFERSIAGITDEAYLTEIRAIHERTMAMTPKERAERFMDSGPVVLAKALAPEAGRKAQNAQTDAASKLIDSLEERQS